MHQLIQAAKGLQLKEELKRRMEAQRLAPPTPVLSHPIEEEGFALSPRKQSSRVNLEKAAKLEKQVVALILITSYCISSTYCSWSSADWWIEFQY